MSTGGLYRPIDYWDWCLVNSEGCKVCEGSGLNPFFYGKDKCPACKADYELALQDDQDKWLRHIENPAFPVSAEAASKTAHYF